MKIAVIGATGMAGKAIYQEATERGHEVTGIVRSEARGTEILGKDARLLVKDAFGLQQEDLSQFDVIVNAFAAPPHQAYLHVDLTTQLIAQFRETASPRLFFILGAGSLLDENNQPFIETIRHMPNADQWISIPDNQFKQLEFLRKVDNVNWVGVSPSFEFVEGPKQTPVLGKDHLLKTADGSSRSTSGTVAAAILNEIEQPQFKQERFTVSD